MPLSSLMLSLRKSPITEELIQRAKRPLRLQLSGAGRAGRSLITTSLATDEHRPLLVIVPTLEEATRWFSLLQLMGWDKTYLYPSSEGSPYDSFVSTSNNQEYFNDSSRSSLV